MSRNAQTESVDPEVFPSAYVNAVLLALLVLICLALA